MLPSRHAPPAAVWISAVVGPALVLAGCGGGSLPAAPPPTPGGTVSTLGPSSASPRPDALSIVVDDGSGTKTTWRLTCDPPSGTHPDPDAACRVLSTNAAKALPAVPRDRVCTQIYGGAARATITGVWLGQPVRSALSLRNGCEIARWKMLEGLLPPAGG